MKTAVVTGASSGIGRAIAVRLAEQGVSVIATGRNQERLKELQKSAHGGIRLVVGNLNTEGTRSAIHEQVLNSDEGPIILINAAGIAQFGDFATMAPSTLDEQMETNFSSPMHLIQLLLPAILKRKGSQIINIGSISAKFTFAEADAYSASKAALTSLGNTLLAGYRKEGLRLTTLHAGAVDTPIWDSQNFNPDRTNMLTPEDVAEVVNFLVFANENLNIDELTVMPRDGIL